MRESRVSGFAITLLLLQMLVVAVCISFDLENESLNIEHRFVVLLYILESERGVNHNQVSDSEVELIRC